MNVLVLRLELIITIALALMKASLDTRVGRHLMVLQVELDQLGIRPDFNRMANEGRKYIESLVVKSKNPIEDEFRFEYLMDVRQRVLRLKSFNDDAARQRTSTGEARTGKPSKPIVTAESTNLSVANDPSISRDSRSSVGSTEGSNDDPGEGKKKKRRVVKIRTHNTPHGIDFEDGQYVATITVAGAPVRLPPRPDVDSAVLLRDTVLNEIATGYVESDNPNPVDIANSITQPVTVDVILPETQPLQEDVHMGEQDDDALTPKKVTQPTRQSAGTRTPMTVPHKVGSALRKENIDILKFREKFYARIPLFRDFVTTPMRLTKTEAENDVSAVINEMRKYNLEVELTPHEQAGITDRLKLFVSSMSASVSAPASGPSTPQPVKRGGLPSGVKKVGDESYCAVLDLFGNSYSTPQRPNVGLVIEDQTKVSTEVKRLMSLVNSSKASRQGSSLNDALARFIDGLKPVPIHRVRDKLYSTIEFMGASLTTPLRTSAHEVEADRTVAMDILKANDSMERQAIVDKIRSRWAATGGGGGVGKVDNHARINN